MYKQRLQRMQNPVDRPQDRDSALGAIFLVGLFWPCISCGGWGRVPIARFIYLPSIHKKPNQRAVVFLFSFLGFLHTMHTHQPHHYKGRIINPSPRPPLATIPFLSAHLEFVFVPATAYLRTCGTYMAESERTGARDVSRPRYNKSLRGVHYKEGPTYTNSQRSGEAELGSRTPWHL